MDIEHEYELLETTKKEAGEIVQFLVAYHEIKQDEIDFDN